MYREWQALMTHRVKTVQCLKSVISKNFLLVIVWNVSERVPFMQYGMYAQEHFSRLIKNKERKPFKKKKTGFFEDIFKELQRDYPHRSKLKDWVSSLGIVAQILKSHRLYSNEGHRKDCWSFLFFFFGLPSHIANYWPGMHIAWRHIWSSMWTGVRLCGVCQN